MYVTSSYDIFLRFHRKLWNMLFVGCFCITLSYAEERNDDWVRVYNGKIAEIYLQNDMTANSTPIPLDKVIIAISADPKEKKNVTDSDPLILVNYISKEQSKLGCVYTPNKNDIFNNSRGLDSSEICKKLTGLEHVKSAFHECYEKHHNVFFVSFDLSQTQCLNGTGYPVSSEHLENLVMRPSDKEGYVIASWSNFDNGYKKITYPDDKNYYGRERQGVRNYYDSYQNRIFGCQEYGQPFSRLTKEMPQDYPSKNASFYFTLSDPYDHVALWQKQYLIKTKGFYDRDLWGAWRIIDEPIHIGLNLNDGTVLLKGMSSILRVRYEDGETKAPESIVKVKEPSVIRAYFDKHGGFVECDADRIMRGICDLDTAPNYQEGQKMSEKQFNKAVIEGTDKIIQEYFEQGNK
ncbi:hypothetical protein [Sulfurospirillum multivorans]|uniref:Periplasmic protein n=2 Tax=Sulfurospirillum multivorans TaxID=66821 RepID=A0AA86AM98_SULMK|nr:hypothetical protein [Sulfurospirillum multivorans]AHJ12377.1 putative periplasmic protein [Sulfurospirillum multivorans DSM 12446]QEH05875.1 putative periplasmic protein [Sulfurospirillum multivorans]